MKCKKYKEQVILHLYGELSEEEIQSLRKHIEHCPDCAKDTAYTQEVFKLMEEEKIQDAPEANWERSWAHIQSEILNNPRKRRKFAFSPAWATAAAGIILVFALGIFIGRFWAPSRQPVLAQADFTSEYARFTLQEHFDTLKPLLVEYSNYSRGENGDTGIVIDREILRNLLIQNYLLMRMVAKDDPTAASLLEDIGLVLREVSNMESGDRDAPSMVKELIDQREILFKMEIMQKT
jgi:hypothetical protein